MRVEYGSCSCWQEPMAASLIKVLGVRGPSGRWRWRALCAPASSHWMMSGGRRSRDQKTCRLRPQACIHLHLAHPPTSIRQYFAVLRTPYFYPDAVLGSRFLVDLNDKFASLVSKVLNNGAAASCSPSSLSTRQSPVRP